VTLTFDLWPWKSIGFQTLIRTKYVPCLVKIHSRMLILECSRGCYVVKIWHHDYSTWKWIITYFRHFSQAVCDPNLILLAFVIPSPTKLRRDIVTLLSPSLVKIHWRMLILVFTRMLCGKNLTHWPLTLKINKVPDSPKDYVCTQFGQNPLKDVDSRVFTRMLQGQIFPA
jgi:hypothetical protein